MATAAGTHKVATLLMNMDPMTATQLLQGLSEDEIQQIAMEMAYIESSGKRDARKEEKLVQEFSGAIQKKRSHGLSIRSFLNETLVNLLSKEKTTKIQEKVRKVTEVEDPFDAIRMANDDELALALQNEHPQAIAVILSELDTKKSQKILPLLEQETSFAVIRKLAQPTLLSSEVKNCIASTIGKRLKGLEGKTVSAKPKQNLRKLAILLSDLGRDLRDLLLGEIAKVDEETSATVRNLMITWEDIPTIADRSLQEALRAVEISKLAIALFGADEEIVQKIRSNISSRAATMLDEEISLMQEPLEEEVLAAREEVAQPLREANEEGTLRRVKTAK